MISGNPRGRAVWRVTATSQLYVAERTFATLAEAHAWASELTSARVTIERFWEGA